MSLTRRIMLLTAAVILALVLREGWHMYRTYQEAQAEEARAKAQSAAEAAVNAAKYADYLLDLRKEFDAGTTVPDSLAADPFRSVAFLDARRFDLENQVAPFPGTDPVPYADLGIDSIRAYATFGTLTDDIARRILAIWRTVPYVTQDSVAGVYREDLTEFEMKFNELNLHFFDEMLQKADLSYQDVGTSDAELRRLAIRNLRERIAFWRPLDDTGLKHTVACADSLERRFRITDADIGLTAKDRRIAEAASYGP